jgi:hypothetical protein
MIEVSGNREDMVMTERSEEFVQQTEPFRRELLAHCYRMVGSVDEAEDLVQETYLRAWRSYGTFEGHSSLWAAGPALRRVRSLRVGRGSAPRVLVQHADDGEDPAVVVLGRRHPDVHDRDVGPVLGDGRAQRVGVRDRCRDLVAAHRQHLGEQLAQRGCVLGDHYAHGCSLAHTPLAGPAVKAELRELLSAELANVLGHPDPSMLADDKPFDALGFDWLTVIEVRNRLSQLSGLTLSATLLFNRPTVAQLAEHLHHELTRAGRADAQRPDAAG